VTGCRIVCIVSFQVNVIVQLPRGVEEWPDG
jgi:hypothetical protein